MLAKELTHLTLMQGEEIEQLKEENKVLKEANQGLADVVSDCEDEIKIIQQIRDELLAALKQISDKDCFDPPTLDYLIGNAEALKKEESK